LVFFWLFVDIPGDYQADYLGNFPLNFPFYANYPNAIAVPDQAALLAPFYNIIATVLNQQWQQLVPKTPTDEMQS